MEVSNSILKENTILPMRISCHGGYFFVDKDCVFNFHDCKGVFHSVLASDIWSISFVCPDWESYINSEAWQWRKEKYFKENEKKCYCCGKTENVQLHHITYEHMGCELDSELEPLCARCHEQLHYIKNQIPNTCKSDEERDAIIRQLVCSQFPHCIAGHKTHMASVIARTLNYSSPSAELIKFLKRI